MKTLTLIQGTQEWAAHRATARNASDAPAMLGYSQYKSRSELLRQRATGIVSEVDSATQARFNEGHAAEEAARPNAERIIGDELYAAVGTTDDGYLSASMDGCTMDNKIIWENKLYNRSLATWIEENLGLPNTHWPQVEQQLLVSGADRCLFTLADRDGTIRLQHWYTSIDSRREIVIDGWKQFDEDLANYQHTETKAGLTGKAPESLPALRIEVTGMVTASNLDAFRDHALSVFRNINTDLKTDEDFANAEKTVKWCSDVESKLESAKQHALSQTATIDELFRAVDSIKAEARTIRLDLEKKVKTEKENIKARMIIAVRTEYDAHIAKLNERLKKTTMPPIHVDFAGAIKGLKTVSSMQDKLDGALATAKIAANETSEKLMASIDYFVRVVQSHERHLFPDMQSLLLKPLPDMEAIIKSRLREDADRQDRIAAEAAAKSEQAQKQSANDIQVVVTHPPTKLVQADNSRPSDDEIIAALCAAFGENKTTVLRWIKEMRLQEAAA